MELPENLLCLFSAKVDEQDGSYVLEVPQREVVLGDVESGAVHQIAILSSASSTATPTSSERSYAEAPPVEEGDVVDVEIEDVGDKGDGIARVGPGYVVIVPGTELGERVSIEITEVRENMAFADVLERQDQFS